MGAKLHIFWQFTKQKKRKRKIIHNPKAIFYNLFQVFVVILHPEM